MATVKLGGGFPSDDRTRMNELPIFRGLIVAFAAMYVLTMSTAGLGPDAPALALEYQRWIEAQPVAGGAWGLSCAVGHLLDVVGLAAMSMRRRWGLWLLFLGFVACLGAGGGFPEVQSHGQGLMMALTNILWGAMVCLAVVRGSVLFRRGNAS